jgi:hypothetical protein
MQGSTMESVRLVDAVVSLTTRWSCPMSHGIYMDPCYNRQGVNPRDTIGRILSFGANSRE